MNATVLKTATVPALQPPLAVTNSSTHPPQNSYPCPGTEALCRLGVDPHEEGTRRACKIFEVRRTNPLSTSGAADFAPSADMTIANKDVL